MKHTKQTGRMSHRIMAFFLTVCMAATLFSPPISAQAAESPSKPISLCGFAALSNEIKEQSVPLGVSLAALKLPDTLEATARPASADTEPVLPEEPEKQPAPLSIQNVTWKSDPVYSDAAPGIYTFTAVLPQGYALQEGVVLPKILVTIAAEVLEKTAYEQTAELFLALPSADRITAETTGEEKEAIRTRLDEAMAAYDALTEAEQARFDEECADLLIAALALNDALTGNAMNTLAAAPVTLYISSTAENDTAVRADGATYKTVMGAYVQAQSGDTIKLGSDITTPDTESRVFYKSIIFDFDGYTMTCSFNPSGTYGLCNYSQNSVLTITDSSENKTGKMVIQSTKSGQFLTVAVGACNGGKVIIENCTIVAPAAAALPIYQNFYALQASGTGSADKASTAEVTVTLNVIGSWSEDSLALGGNLYAINSGSGGAVYVRDGAVVNAPGGMIGGDGARVWFTPSSAGKLVCKGTAGTVAIPLIKDMQLTKDLNNGMVSFRVMSNADVTLDLNGYNLSGNQINIIVGGKAKLHIMNSSDSPSTITNGEANAHNIVNYGDLTIDGKVKIVNRSASSAYACIYQEGDSFPDIPQKPADYERNVAKSVLGKDVILDANYAAMYVDWSYQDSSFITVNGSTLSSQKTTPMQVPNGNVTINGATFIASQDEILTSRIEGFFAGTNTRYEIKLPVTEWWWLENVLLNEFNHVSLTARDNGIYLDERLQSGGNAAAAFAFSNIALNKGKTTPALTGIMNLSGKNITLSGKDTYFVCDELYATQDNYVAEDNIPLGHTDPAGTLTITGGIFSVDPIAYVPDTNSDGIKDYAVLDYANATVSNYYLVAPWTKVGTDNIVSLYYPASAVATDTASDDVSIMALNDTEGIIPDATRVQARHFTLSSKEGTFTAIDGLSVTAFTNGNRLTVQKTKACAATEAYVWYGGKSVGRIILESKSDPTYDVGGEITGATGKPTAYLIRDGVKYHATVTGNDNPYQYVVRNVPAGIYNLVVSSATTESQTENIITTTVLVTIINQSIAQDVALPQKIHNSVVTTVGDNTPNVEAGGLDDMAKTVGTPDANTYVLIELKVVENEGSDRADDVKAAITGDGMVKGIIMDTDVLKTVNNDAPVEITEITPEDHGVSLITVVFHLPENLQGKEGYAIFRYHGTQVNKITEKVNSNGEYMTVNAEKDTITAHLNKFSTYSIAYTEKTAGQTTVTFDANGGSVTPASAKTNAENKLDTLPTPTRSGSYSFDGWYTSADGGTKVTTATVFSSDSTIYAHWAYQGDSADYYTITATAGAGGTISPSGSVSVREHSDKTFTFTPDKGYIVSDVLVDGVRVGAAESYAFKNVQKSHSIQVTFTERAKAIALDKVNHFAYMLGYPTGEFGPNRNMTRAEAIVMFSRLLLEKMDTDKSYSCSFSDITGNEWYADAVGYMEQFGIISGYPDGTFGGNKPIKRAEFAAIATRFDALLLDKPNPFADVASTHWASGYIAAAADKGWIAGYPDGTFKPENYITRAEVVTIVNHMLDRKADGAFVRAHRDAVVFTDLQNVEDWYYYDMVEASIGHKYERSADGAELWTSIQK